MKNKSLAIVAALLLSAGLAFAYVSSNTTCCAPESCKTSDQTCCGMPVEDCCK